MRRKIEGTCIGKLEGVFRSMQKLKPCKFCTHPVSLTAKRCPSCGGKSPYQHDPAVVGGVMFFIVLLIVSPCIITSILSEDSVEEQIKNGSYERDPKYQDMTNEELDSAIRFYTKELAALMGKSRTQWLSDGELMSWDSCEDEIARLEYERRLRIRDGDYTLGMDNEE